MVVKENNVNEEILKKKNHWLNACQLFITLNLISTVFFVWVAKEKKK